MASDLDSYRLVYGNQALRHLRHLEPSNIDRVCAGPLQVRFANSENGCGAHSSNKHSKL